MHWHAEILSHETAVVIGCISRLLQPEITPSDIPEIHRIGMSVGKEIIGGFLVMYTQIKYTGISCCGVWIGPAVKMGPVRKCMIGKKSPTEIRRITFFPHYNEISRLFDLIFPAAILIVGTH